MPAVIDGPASPLFKPVTLKGNISLEGLASPGVSDVMAAARQHAPSGSCVAWGIPFEVGDVLLINDHPVEVEIHPTKARWFVFMHTADHKLLPTGPGGFTSPARGPSMLGEHAADYVFCYADGTQEQVALTRRRQVGEFRGGWGESALEAVGGRKNYPMRASHEQLIEGWGGSQTRASTGEGAPWVNWLWAWENPHPEKAVTGFRFEPGESPLVLSAISAGSASSLPLRWQTRQKACLALPKGETFEPNLDEWGLLRQVQLDLGQVISAAPRPLYPNDTWAATYDNQRPRLVENEVIVEYTAHPDACFHLSDGKVIPLTQVAANQPSGPVRPVAPSTQPVKLRVVERRSGKTVPVKLHLHGEAGEYLAPVDRHRIINTAWYEDYSVDFSHINWPQPAASHPCTYINGEAQLKLPLGRVYLEVSKGFEIKPLRKVLEIKPGMEGVTVEIEKVLPWREQGWVTADTHVHFLSPISAMLEGSGEGVNVINLLASQWGELMTNVGDFDGRTTWGSKEAGGDGEYLVRVGTENRQHVMGHISLLGYQGPIIAPMTTGGPDESALGDPIEILLTEWARQCHQQDGLVVLPHFPFPRSEHAASIIEGDIDAIEMTSWEDHYAGINPYSLSDWYRYLNCGYLVPAVGGTDKMAAVTAVGTVRTYARIDPQKGFSYETWKEAVKRAETFVTYGPLLEFSVDGRTMGSRMALPARGGTLDVTWKTASVTIPMSRVELVVNGEIRESMPVAAWEAGGSWKVKVEKSAWLALLVRGHYADQPEIITAHSTPVMVQVEGSPMLPAADAVTILEQIEGAMAYLDTVGTRAEDRVYKRMRLVLETAHRRLHNRMHQMGYFHEHTPTEGHAEHKG